jgi:hypothetical protein
MSVFTLVGSLGKWVSGKIEKAIIASLEIM